MVDLEKYAVQRDKSFLWRLILALLAALLFGIWLFAALTGGAVHGCAARSFGALTGAPTEKLENR